MNGYEVVKGKPTTMRIHLFYTGLQSAEETVLTF